VEHRRYADGVGCLVFVFLLLALVFVGVGFVAHLLWIAAIVFFVAWVAGLAFGAGRRRGEPPR
jgi:hypothetical protein